MAALSSLEGKFLAFLQAEFTFWLLDISSKLHGNLYATQTSVV